MCKPVSSGGRPSFEIEQTDVGFDSRAKGRIAIGFERALEGTDGLGPCAVLGQFAGLSFNLPEALLRVHRGRRCSPTCASCEASIVGP
jgi:hypothetical protein